MKPTNPIESQMEGSEVTASSPSDNPERVFEQFSIPIGPVDQVPEMQILTTESPAYRVHIKSN